jgi:hypothetical protein
MEDLIQLDEERWCVGENINHMQFLKKENWFGKGKIKSFDEGDLVYGCPKLLKQNRVNLDYHGRVHTKYIIFLIITLWH